VRARYNSLSYVEKSSPPRIRFHLTITNDGNRAIFFGFRGELYYYIPTKDEYDIGDGSILLGNIIESRYNMLDIDHERSRDIDLDFTLDPYVKNIIEQRRDGDLQVKIYLSCYKMEIDAQDKQVLGIDQTHVYDPIHQNILRIPRSKWADILQAGGYDSYQIIEIPINYEDIISTASALSTVEFQGRLRKASEQLSTIMRYMNEGRWRVAVSECRKAFEALTKGTIKVQGEDKSAVKVICELLLGSGMPMENAEAFRRLIDNFTSFTHTQHHIQSLGEEIELEVPIDREDALFTVTTLVTIINLLTRKYRKLSYST